MEFSTELRNARIGQIETIAGASPRLMVRSGAKPVNAAAADAGTVLADITLPADWLTAPSNGGVSKSGTWTDAAADASGTAGHWRLYKADGTTCVAQGTVGTSGAELNLLSLTFVAGQPFTIDSWTFTDGNA
jgi:hypothetical protein